MRWHAAISLRLHFYASWFSKNKRLAKLPTCRRPAVQHSEQHKKISGFAWRWQGTAATQKINSIAMLAELYFFVLQCGGGYLYIMCLIGFFFRACLHERSQKMRSEPIRPHYVNVASGSFFWRGFLFCVRGALVYFFCKYFFKNYRFIYKKIK